jgi:hypothetical protein
MLSFVGISQINTTTIRMNDIRRDVTYIKKKFKISDYVKMDSVMIDTDMFMSEIYHKNLIKEFNEGTLSKFEVDDIIEKSKISILKSPIIINNNQEKIIIQQDSISKSTPPGKGDLVYVIKDTMTIYQPYTIDVTLSKGMDNKQLIKIIDSYKNKTLIDTLIDVSPIMSAKVIDPTGKNFIISPTTSEIQNTTGKNLIRWQWQVVPHVEGDNYLTINVNNIIDGNPQSVNIYNGRTYVYSKHTIPGDFWNWVKINWTYITYVIGLIGAIFAFIYKEKLFGFFRRKE